MRKYVRYYFYAVSASVGHNKFINLTFVATFSFQFSIIIQKFMDYENLLFDTLYFETLEAVNVFVKILNLYFTLFLQALIQVSTQSIGTQLIVTTNTRNTSAVVF